MTGSTYTVAVAFSQNSQIHLRQDCECAMGDCGNHKYIPFGFAPSLNGWQQMRLLVLGIVYLFNYTLACNMCADVIKVMLFL